MIANFFIPLRLKLDLRIFFLRCKKEPVFDPMALDLRRRESKIVPVNDFETTKDVDISGKDWPINKKTAIICSGTLLQ